MTRNKYILNLLLVAASLLLVAAVSEMAMRLYYHSNHGNTEAVCLQGDEELIYRFQADSKDCSTNSRGYVDYEYDFERKQSGKRIVIIGDSVASGQGVPFGKSFAKLLEKRLNDMSSTRFEVIVLAVPGYSTSQEIVLLKNEAFLYNPDLVVIAYHPNDPAHPLYHNAGGQVGIHFRKPLSYAWFYLQRLIFRVKSRVRSIWNSYPTTPWCLSLHRVYWSEVEESFREITAVAQEQSTPVVFAFLPLLLEPDQGKGMDELYRQLVELASKNGARAVNLMPPFLGENIESVRLPDDAWHPNEKGHQIIAERLFRFFQEDRFLFPDADSEPLNTAQ